jgi:magnesium chelatase subunit I
MGGAVRLGQDIPSATVVQDLGKIQGLLDKTGALGLTANESDAVRASAGEFILEGLYAHKRISRSEEHEFRAGERRREQSPEDVRPQKGQARRHYQ